MTTKSGAMLAKLARVDLRKIGQWGADRARNTIRAGGWHASRWRMQLQDLLRRSVPLPPGSLAARQRHKALEDDRFYLKQAARHGPIFKLFWGSGQLKTCVVGLSLGRRLLKQHRGLLRLVNVTDITSLVPAEYLRSMSPESHQKYRRVFQHAFRGDLVAPVETDLRDLLRRELMRLAEPAMPVEPPARRLYSTLDTIATKSLLLTMLGVMPDSSTATALEEWYGQLGPEGRVAQVGPAQKSAFAAIHGTVARLLQSIDSEPRATIRDCALKRLMNAGSPAVDETVIGNAIYMVERGRHDLRDLLRWILKYLSDDPAPLAEIRTGLRNTAGTSRLAEACVLETLRLDQAEQLNRKALRPFVFGGFHFPAGSWVSVLLRESHRDAETFPQPDAFRPHRFLERSYSTDEYAPFGIDEHQCIGASLVVRLGTLFVEELARRFTWTVSADGARQHGALHWEPSPDFAIDLRRCDLTHHRTS